MLRDTMEIELELQMELWWGLYLELGRVRLSHRLALE